MTDDAPDTKKPPGPRREPRPGGAVRRPSGGAYPAEGAGAAMTGELVVPDDVRMAR